MMYNKYDQIAHGIYFIINLFGDTNVDTIIFLVKLKKSLIPREARCEFILGQSEYSDRKKGMHVQEKKTFKDTHSTSNTIKEESIKKETSHNSINRVTRIICPSKKK